MRRTFALPAILFLVTASLTAGMWTTELQQYFIHRKPPLRFSGVAAADFSPNRRTIALARNDGRLQLIRLSNLKTNSHFDLGAIAGKPGQTTAALAFSPNRPILAAAYPGANKVILYNTAKQKLIQRIKTHFAPQRLRFSPGGRFLLIGADKYRDRWLHVQNIMRQKAVLAVKNPVVGAVTRDERFFYYTNPAIDNNNLVEFSLLSEQTIRNRPISRFAAGQQLLSLHVLRNHKLLFGYADRAVLVDRALKTMENIIMTGNHPVDCIAARGDERFLLLGNKNGWKICYLPSRVILPAAPLQQQCRAALYPGGSYYLLVKEDGSAAIHPLPAFTRK